MALRVTLPILTSLPSSLPSTRNLLISRKSSKAFCNKPVFFFHSGDFILSVRNYSTSIRTPCADILKVGRRQKYSGKVRASSAGNSTMALEKVQIVRNGDGEVTFDAYVIGPEGGPGVVVIQEWWGVDYEIKNHATYLAGKGFRALIPDLYRGKVALEQAEAQHYLEGLDWPGAVKDIAASAKWLKEHGSPKVGVTGFCMGGALTVAAAVLVDDISAAVPFYGIPPLQLADPAKAKVPVQAHFGGSDPMKGFSDPESGKALQESLNRAGVENELYIYPGQGHAFMNASEEGIQRKVGQGNPPHDQSAVDLAWSRVEAWFGKYLK